MGLELLLPFLAGCLLAGILGRKRRIGFWGFFFASIVFTPLITISFLYFAMPVEVVKPGTPRGGDQK